MHDARGMHGGERVADLHRDRQELRGREAPLRFQAMSERLAAQELHHVIRDAVGRRTGVDDVDDVRVMQLAEGAPFVAHPRDEVAPIRERAQQRFQDVTASELLVLDDVDRAHAARAEERYDFVRSPRNGGSIFVFAGPVLVGHAPSGPSKGPPSYHHLGISSGRYVLGLLARPGCQEQVWLQSHEARPSTRTFRAASPSRILE